MGARGIRDVWFCLAIVVALYSGTDSVLAQALGTYRWQLQPFCNVVTLTIAIENGVYTLDGVDDGCGVGPPATVRGTAFLNPDGSIGLGWSSSIPPLVSPLVLEARLDIATLGGTWSDSAGNSGVLSFAPGGSLGGPTRPVSPNGLRPASIVAVSTGPSSRTSDRLIVAPRLLSRCRNRNWSIVCTAMTIPMKAPVSITIGRTTNPLSW